MSKGIKTMMGKLTESTELSRWELTDSGLRSCEHKIKLGPPIQVAVL